MGIRCFWTAEQAQAHNVAQSRKAIFGVIEDGNTVTEFGQIRPFVADDFEFGVVPRRIIMSWTSDDAELGFVRCLR